ncbi:MAG: UDP-N-acetylmuramoylalanine--D-glutamate ligase [Epulopiscium sp. Nele67-Bin004]|nr:MAG: UDP-N-acetylmuramoylalanine--D-glutamate ligase [Epulopiscium sp. Nele67-Bin004]
MTVIVIGCARSGIGAAKLAHTTGNKVVVYDNKPFDKFNEETKQTIKQYEEQGIEFMLGADGFPDVDKVIVSPGVPLEIPVIKHYQNLGIDVMGEFEFASQFCKAPIIGITGTNGKTTTTTIVGEIFSAVNKNTYVVGNIGRAFSEDVLDIPEDGIVIAELSSFQLETIKYLKCHIAAILNISPDHLNRHHTMENYIAAKCRIFENMSGRLILNKEDENLQKIVGTTGTAEIFFSSKNEADGYQKDGALYEHGNKVCDIDELHILGTHNIENTLAAILIARAADVPTSVIRKVLLNFKGVEHRIEYVDTKNGIKFYNDSKATNVGAAIPALYAINKGIRLIGGGMDKQIEFDEWVQLFDGRVEKLYVIGETTNQITQTCEKYGFTNVQDYTTLEEATLAAYNEANAGDSVLLSPACASWDMFESYEKRGELFKEIVKSLKG